MERSKQDNLPTHEKKTLLRECYWRVFARTKQLKDYWGIFVIGAPVTVKIPVLCGSVSKAGLAAGRRRCT